MNGNMHPKVCDRVTASAPRLERNVFTMPSNEFVPKGFLKLLKVDLFRSVARIAQKVDDMFVQVGEPNEVKPSLTVFCSRNGKTVPAILLAQ